MGPAKSDDDSLLPITARDTFSIHRRSYDLIAYEYEAKAPVHLENVKEQVRRFSSYLPRPGGSVLEIGSAVGTAAVALSDLGLRVTGIDLSPRMIAFAQNRAPSAKFICGDFNKLSFVERFDGVYAQSVVHLFPSEYLNAFFLNVRRALKTDGVVLLSTTEASRRASGWEKKGDYYDTPLRYRQHWTKAQFRALLFEGGLEEVDSWSLQDPYEKRWMIFVGRVRTNV